MSKVNKIAIKLKKFRKFRKIAFKNLQILIRTHAQ